MSPGSTPPQVTLDNCASEPIHIPGAVQAHGVLLVCHPPELRISQISANCAHFLGLAPDLALGAPLSALLDAASHARVAALLSLPDLRRENPLWVVAQNGASFDAVAHRSGGALLLELEPAAAQLNPHQTSFDPRLRATLLRLQGASDVQTLCQHAAEEVRSLTGFDRVMVYRFDRDWNGEVVAECKDEALEPFLGQHYPASDIPEQARRLYTINWLRFIADVDYTPAPLLPELDPVSAAPLDLSHAQLRSVSPIHIEYLKNMGVRASMSVSLLVDGKLAGLIACHHYMGPHLLPVRMRDTAEYVGRALSWQLGTLEAADLAKHRQAAQAQEAEVMRSVAVASDLLDGLETPALLALTEARARRSC